jgi:uncharacterized protein YndB with AHSA1/START domain
MVALAVARTDRLAKLRSVTRQFASFVIVTAALAWSSVAAAEPVRVTTRVEADRSRTMVHEALVRAAIAHVWEAIATPQGWMTWAVPLARASVADPDVLETSYNKADRPGSPSTIQQRFVAQIPGRLLVFRTIKAPAGFPHWETYRGVTSIFELEPVGTETRVRLTSVGYPDTAAGRALVAFFERGNAETLEHLQRRFVTGPVDWQKR